MEVKTFKLILNNSNKKYIENNSKINSKNINNYIAKGIKSNELEIKFDLLNRDVVDLKDKINELKYLNEELITLISIFVGVDG